MLLLLNALTSPAKPLSSGSLASRTKLLIVPGRKESLPISIWRPRGTLNGTHPVTEGSLLSRLPVASLPQ